MGWVSRYCARLAAFMRSGRRRSPAVSADVEGLRIGDEQVAWSDVRRLEAYKRDDYVGDLLGMVILAADGRLFAIDETSPGWPEIGAAINRYLPEALPHAEWSLRLIAAQPGESVAIFPHVAQR